MEGTGDGGGGISPTMYESNVSRAEYFRLGKNNEMLNQIVVQNVGPGPLTASFDVRKGRFCNPGGSIALLFFSGMCNPDSVS